MYVHSIILAILVNALVKNLVRYFSKKVLQFLMISQSGAKWCKKGLLAWKEIIESQKGFSDLTKSYSLSKENISGSRCPESRIKKNSGIMAW